MLEDCGPGAIRLLALQEPLRGDLCIPLYVFLAGGNWNVSILNPHCAAVLTLCACTPPLDQVLQLWDFLLAFGVHLNVLCVIAQLLLIRDDVMKSSRYAAACLLHTPYSHFGSPMRLLRTFPPLEALPVIGIAVTLVRDIPTDLYDELVRHPYAMSEQH